VCYRRRYLRKDCTQIIILVYNIINPENWKRGKLQVMGGQTGKLRIQAPKSFIGDNIQIYKFSLLYPHHTHTHTHIHSGKGAEGRKLTAF
jgi:hypothetical protein